MQKDRREKIMLKAIELYLLDGFDHVSITDLQCELDMGRGTMYYYFKNKDELFCAVMERYFLVPKRQLFASVDDSVTMEQMIDKLLDYFAYLQEVLSYFDNKKINTSNVVTMMFTAYNRFPHLYKQARIIYERELHLWKCALRNGIKNGTLRPDTDVELMANILTHLKDGYDTARSGITMDFGIIPKQYHYIYQLLSV